MDLRLLELPANIPVATYGVIGFVTAIYVFTKLSRARNLDAFPTARSSPWLGSWWTACRYVVNSQSIIQKGYEEHKPAPFKVPELHHWTIMLSNRKHVEELARASDDEFSFLAAIDDQIQFRYTLGHEILDNPYHIRILRSRLDRNMQTMYPAIRNEVVTSFDEALDLKGNEWKSIPVLSSMEIIVCRVTGRLFVGQPLCRNHEWIDLNVRYSVDAIKGGVTIGLFPRFMRGYATRFLTNVPRNTARAAQLLGPVIEERQRYLKEYGAEWDDKPNDFLSWLIDEAEGPEFTPECLTKRVLITSFASIHTTANVFAQVLLCLAANPQYIQPLREEVEGIIETDGWSKATLQRMRKIDSFLRECQRIEGVNIVTLSRKAMKDFTFSDGTFIPKGTMVVAPTMSLNHDGDIYENPEVFDPFRFVDLHSEEGTALKNRFASTSPEYLTFGHGVHACPGRVFAANELKTMLAHIVVTYDIKLEEGTTSPKSWCVGTLIGANHHAKIMFRNRVK